MVETVLPGLLFVTIYTINKDLHVSALAALGVSLLLVVFRLIRRDTVKHAFSGVFGVAFGVVFAMMTGNAKDFYLPGMLYTLGLGVAYIATTLAGVRHRADPRPDLQGEPLLAHPQPRSQEGVCEGQLCLGPDPAREVRDPVPCSTGGLTPRSSAGCWSRSRSRRSCWRST